MRAVGKDGRTTFVPGVTVLYRALAEGTKEPQAELAADLAGDPSAGAEPSLKRAQDK